MLNVAICILTCNRQSLLRNCLNHINLLRIDSRFKISVILIDNSSDGNATTVYNQYKTEFKFDMIYVHEKKKGIPSARNTGIKKAISINTKYIAFIDDDEYPDINWVSNFLSYATTNNLIIVSGPVVPVFDPSCSYLFKNTIFYLQHRYKSGISLRDFSTNNLLIESSVFLKYDLFFDENMALQGGSDTDFSIRANLKGLKSVWCDEALVFEIIPPSRCTLKWLFLRSYRGGTNYTFFRKKYNLSKTPYFTSLINGILRLSTGIIIGLLSIGIIKRLIFRSVQNIGLGAGLIAGIFNVKYYEYKSIHKT